MRFWALESLLLHSDGYSGNRNNFYMYASPEQSGRFQFLLWGIDGIFRAYDVVDNGIQSVYGQGAIARKLYQTPEGKRRYFEALNTLLDNVWNETQLLSRIEEMRALLSTWITNPRERSVVNDDIDLLSDIIRTRRSTIEAELAIGEPRLEEEIEPLLCLTPFGSVRSSFDTTWGMINQEPSDWFITDEQQLDIVLTDDENPMIRSVGSAAGADNEFGPRLNILGSLGFNEYLLFNVSLAEENWRSGSQEVWSELYYSGTESDYEIVYIASAYIELNLESGGSNIGDSIIGSLDGDLLSWGE